MNVKIIIDSTADVKPELKPRFTVVPLTVHFGDREYIDGVTITQTAFYEKLEKSDVLPSTSQATPASFEPVFREISQAGDSAVVLTLASALSGTYQSARIAAEVYENIFVVDSGSVTIGSGILAELALKLADQGLCAADIAAQLEQQKKNVRIVAMVDTLEYLKRGGRISKTVAFAGELLNIKPVIGVIDGQIQMLGKARGIRQGSKLMTAHIDSAGGIDISKPVLLGYTGCSDLLLKQYIQQNSQLWQDAPEAPAYTVVGSVIGTHAGPGAIAAAFFKR